jgi:hypothetical protein
MRKLFRLSLLSLPALVLTLPAVVLIWSCAPVDDTNQTPKSDEQTLPLPKQSSSTVEHPQRVLAAIKQVRDRQLLISNSFWTVFHGILGNGIDTTLLDPQTNQKVPAVEYISAGGEIRGLRFLVTKFGLDVQTGPPFIGQGHQDQYIAEMAQWGMKADQPYVVNGKEFTYEAFVRHSEARATVKADQELSWTILLLAQFRGTSYTWTNERGEALKYEDIVRYELDQPIDGAACGGTHRLFGLTWSYHLHLQNGGKKEGVWLDVEKKIEEQINRAKQYRNPDGSFSSKYLAGPGKTTDLQTRISTSGHVLEWIALAVSDEQLKEAWMQESANALADMIENSSDQAIESGGLYHATHGLQIYYTRRFGQVPEAPKVLIPPHPSITAKNNRK